MIDRRRFLEFFALLGLIGWARRPGPDGVAQARPALLDPHVDEEIVEHWGWMIRVSDLRD